MYEKVNNFFEVSDNFGNKFGKDESILDWHFDRKLNETQPIFPDIDGLFHSEL